MEHFLVNAQLDEAFLEGATFSEVDLKRADLEGAVLKGANFDGGGLQNKTRFFKLVSVNGKEVDGGRYELPTTTKSGKAQTRGPKDKASTAFSEICKKITKKINAYINLLFKKKHMEAIKKYIIIKKKEKN